VPFEEAAKTSSKRNGVVEAYAANTNKGLSMSYNSDRISIVTNLFPPKSRRSMFKSSSSINTDETRSVENDFDLPKWPRCSFFGIFDGHNGLACAEFLRDNLHKYIIRDSHFPNDPRRAIRNGIE